MVNLRLFFNAYIIAVVLFCGSSPAAAQCDADVADIAVRYITALDRPDQAATVRDLSSSQRQASASQEAIRQGMATRDVAFGIYPLGKESRTAPAQKHSKSYIHMPLRSTPVSTGCEMVYETDYPVGTWYQTIVVGRTSAGLRVIHFSEANKLVVSKLEFRFKVSVTIDCAHARCNAIENPFAANPGSLVQVIRLSMGTGQPRSYTLPIATNGTMSEWTSVALESSPTNVTLLVPSDAQDATNRYLKNDSPGNSKTFDVSAGSGVLVSIVLRPSHWNRFYYQTHQRLKYVVTLINATNAT